MSESPEEIQLKNLVREGNGSPLQYSCLESPMDGGAWWAAVHGVAKSQTRLSDFTFAHWRRKRQPSPVFLSGESSAGGAWWAAIYGITQSRTRLKWLSSNSSKESGNSPYLPHQKQTNKQKQWYTISHFVHLWNKDNSSVSFMAVTKKKSSYKRLSWTLTVKSILNDNLLKSLLLHLLGIKNHWAFLETLHWE